MSASTGPARLLGIPLGDFGLLSSILLAFATGFLAFFSSWFVAIFALLIWNTLGHHTVNYADSYRFVALPLGIVVMVGGLVFFTGAWLRRRLTGAH
jgi:hypothetical protein